LAASRSHHAWAGLDAVRRPRPRFDPDRGATSKDTAGKPVAGGLRHWLRALPMWPIAYGGQAVTTRIRGFARIAPRLQRGFGIVVIAFALSPTSNTDTLIVAWLTGFYPNGQIGL